MRPQLTRYDMGPGVVAFSTTRHGGCSTGPYASFNVNAYCGDDPDAKFCKYCGTNQETGENIVDAVLNGTAGFPDAPDDDNSAS